MFLYVVCMNLTNQGEEFGGKVLKFYIDKLLLHAGFSALESSEDITRLWSLNRYKTAGHQMLMASQIRNGLLPPVLGLAHVICQDGL